MKFDQAVEIVLDFEGGYVNDPSDPGGETKFGISKRSYPNVDIRNLTKETASEIYKKDYWDAMHCDKLPEGLRLSVFDCAINQGVRRSTWILQTVSRVSADGKIGPQTIYAIEKADSASLLIDFLTERQLHYTRLSTFDRYGRGWTRRIFEIAVKTIVSEK